MQFWADIIHFFPVPGNNGWADEVVLPMTIYANCAVTFQFTDAHDVYMFSEDDHDAYESCDFTKVFVPFVCYVVETFFFHEQN